MGFMRFIGSGSARAYEYQSIDLVALGKVMWILVNARKCMSEGLFIAGIT